MRIYRSLDEVPADFGPSALTIGNFDGVHTGHRSILRRVKQIATERGWKPSALMFDPHPARVVVQHDQQYRGIQPAIAVRLEADLLAAAMLESLLTPISRINTS